MLLKNKIKFIQSLKQKKIRQEYGLFVVEGVKIVSELLNSSVSIKQIVAVPEFFKNKKIDKHIECFEVKVSELERISSLTTPNEVLAICEIPHYKLTATVLENKLTLVLDDIRDPGNLGTIIRVADWFGIETIVCSNETVDAYNPKVVQATMGSISRVKIYEMDLTDFFEKYASKQKMECFGAVLDGENIYSKQLPHFGIVVIGNESNGISEEVLPFITNKISIPSFSHYTNTIGEAESLNAAIATSIICSEFRRRV